MPNRVMAVQNSAKRRLSKTITAGGGASNGQVKGSPPPAKPAPSSPAPAKPGKVQIPENSPLTPKPGKTVPEPKYQIPENNSKNKSATYKSAASAIFNAKRTYRAKTKEVVNPNPLAKAANRKLYG